MEEKRQYEGFLYEELENGDIWITDCAKIDKNPVLVIPESIKDKPVTQVSLETFVDSGKHIEIKDTTISKLSRKEVRLPDTVTTITPFRYYLECNVVKINIPEQLPLSEVSALNLPCIKEFYISEHNKKYTSIDGVLFSADKTELICYPMNRPEQKYYIPDGTKKIGEDAFRIRYKKEIINRDVTHKTVVIPGSVRSIETNAFWDSNVSVEFFHNGVLTLGKQVFLNRPCDNSYFSFAEMEVYTGDAFSFDLLDAVYFNTTCEIQYSKDIDFREYLKFNIQKMLGNSFVFGPVKFNCEYDTWWWDSKNTNHYFRIIISTQSTDLKEKLLSLNLEGLSVSENGLSYQFMGNPTKSHFGQRTYQKYLDGFNKILQAVDSNCY